MVNADHPELKAERRAMIETWRTMVMDVYRQAKAAHDKGELVLILPLLEAHPAFPTFSPHLSERTKKRLFGRTAVTSRDTTPDVGLYWLMKDIEQLEQDWGLQA